MDPMKRALVFFVALLVIAGGIVLAATLKSRTDKVTLPAREVDTFLHAWERGAPADMATLLDRPPADLDQVATGLVDAVPRSSATYTRTGLDGTRDQATATYHGRVVLPGLGPVEWDGMLTLVRTEAGWRVRWNPSSMFPGLRAGQHLTVARTWPARAPILDANGSVLAGNQAVVDVGLEPDHIHSPADLQAIKTNMKALLNVDPATIDSVLHAPGVRPYYFLRVTSIPRDTRYEHIHDTLVPIPGIIFRATKGVVSVDAALESAIVGTVGPITAEQLQRLGPPYTAADSVGLSGLERTYEKRLAGSPRTDVVVVDKSGATARVVKRFPGKAAQPVKLTIDLPTQMAAEAALSGVTNNNAALVALDTGTGAVRAVVSKPDGGFDRALAGTYPPGSTFKVVTSAALLGAGDNGSTPAPCPPTVTVDGRSFKNFEGEASGALDLAEAFAISCNNAFIGLATKLPPGALDKAAASFGFNADWSLGVDSAGGSYPKPADQADLAASAIGQGRVLASPVQMASVAAAVAAGRWHAPNLIVEPARRAGPAVAPLSPVIASTLQSFMASVVRTGGTAAGADLPAGTFGKTGTAEFGQGNPPPTHAWFIGYRGNLAFAVIVERGGVGGRVAAPLAARFLDALPR
jgi:cell division protein FtsI/penicillin-binding protein 2